MTMTLPSFLFVDTVIMCRARYAEALSCSKAFGLGPGLGAEPLHQARMKEQDERSPTRVCWHRVAEASFRALSTALETHLGDTVVVANTHQNAKDILRQSRDNQRSSVHK